MAITRYSTFDRTVNTIADRNEIQHKIDGMTVVVLDAIADINAGASKAVYRWDASDNTWIMITKQGIDTMNFITEELVIVNEMVELSNIPVNNEIWNAVIIDNDAIMADLSTRDVVIERGEIKNIPEQFNGYKLRFTYAYGTLAQQVITAIEETVDMLVISDLYTNIQTTEFEVTLKRGSKQVYGKEIIAEALGDGEILEIPYTFKENYKYWIDSSSFCENTENIFPLNYSGYIGENIGCYLDKLNNKIIIKSNFDMTDYSANIVLYYTK